MDLRILSRFARKRTEGKGLSGFAAAEQDPLDEAVVEAATSDSEGGRRILSEIKRNPRIAHIAEECFGVGSPLRGGTHPGLQRTVASLDQPHSAADFDEVGVQLRKREHLVGVPCAHPGQRQTTPSSVHLIVHALQHSLTPSQQHPDRPNDTRPQRGLGRRSTSTRLPKPPFIRATPGCPRPE